MWLKVYQSAMCWEFSELTTSPCHSLMVPQSQIHGLPISRSVTIITPMIPMEMSAARPQVIPECPGEIVFEISCMVIAPCVPSS